MPFCVAMALAARSSRNESVVAPASADLLQDRNGVTSADGGTLDAVAVIDRERSSRLARFLPTGIRP